MRREHSPIVWTIAGSDSGGGAGIQADLKTMTAFGVHGCSIITALTAQNTLGVETSEPVSESMLRAQLQALASDLPAATIKTGMLGSVETCRMVAEYFLSVDAPVVCDPVLKSTSGSNLLDPAALEMLKTQMIPRATVLTPNLPEARILAGEFARVEEAAERILEMGAQSVLLKGGHAKGRDCRDFWTDGTQSLWLSSPRVETRHTHGTGCILSSAIAAALALGHGMPQALVMAKTFLNQCLKAPAHIGHGQGPMQIRPFEDREEDRPTLLESTL